MQHVETLAGSNANGLFHQRDKKYVGKFMMTLEENDRISL
jgi:hypothetical protein